MTAAGRARMRVQAPLLVVGAAAWLALVLQQGHPVHGAMHAARWTPASLAADAVLMVAAMMVPLAGAPLLHVHDRSLARRRGRAVALFLAGYAVPWIVAAAALRMVADWIGAAQSPALLGGAMLAAAVCQSSPWKQHCLNRGHAHPELAAFGMRADRDVLRFGLSHARWCIGSCAALMLLPLLVSRGHLAVMAGVTLWLAGERLERPLPPCWRWRGPGMVVRVALAQARVWSRRLGTSRPAARPS
jgi:predicted metal-binding membrane protein